MGPVGVATATDVVVVLVARGAVVLVARGVVVLVERRVAGVLEALGTPLGDEETEDVLELVLTVVDMVELMMKLELEELELELMMELELEELELEQGMEPHPGVYLVIS